LESSLLILEARDLIKALLERNPKKRLTVAQALKHPWLAKAETKSKKINHNICSEHF
jgi:serine/threonine protein kinase